MADKVVEQPEVSVEETEKDLKEKKVDEEEIVEAEEKADDTEKEEAKKNGEEWKEANGREAINGESTPAAEEEKCCIKRKSAGGDVEEAKTEEVIPEKKAKLDEDVPAEAEANGAEVVA